MRPVEGIAITGSATFPRIPKVRALITKQVDGAFPIPGYVDFSKFRDTFRRDRREARGK